MSDVLIIDIEGVATRYCWPQLPSYSDATYVLGLRDAPSGVSSQWDVAEGEISVGRWRVTFRPGVGDIEWYKTELQPVASVTVAVTSGAISFTMDRTNTNAGISTGDTLYIGRETLLVGAVTGGSSTLPVKRAEEDSTAAAYAIGTQLYDHPPALLGRKVTLSRADLAGGSTGTETIYQRGFIAGDVKGDLHWPTLTIVERGEAITVNRDPLKREAWFSYPSTNAGDGNFTTRPAHTFSLVDADDPEGVFVAPTVNSTGAYLYLPGSGAVLAVPYSGGEWQIHESRVVWPADGISAQVEPGLAYEVAYSGDAAFPVFGYIPDGGSYTASAHPVDIVLNILLSLDGTNKVASGTNWDRGTALYPHYALGVPVALVDTDSFIRARAALTSIKAGNVWLGGADKLEATHLFRALLAPWGYSVGTTRRGVWRLIQFADVYPGAGSSTVTAESRNRLGLSVSARQVDKMTLQCDLGPDGAGDAYPIVITDPSGASFYPLATGQDQEFEPAPFKSDDLVPELSGYRSDTHAATVASLAQSRVRRLGGRLVTVSFPVAPSLATTLEVGDDIEMSGVWLRDPTDGARITSAETLLARVTSISGMSWGVQRATVDAVLMAQSNLKLARHAPSARVDSWDLGSLTVTVEQATYAAEGDDATDYFEADAVVILLDSTGAPRTDVAGTHRTKVASVTATTIVLDSVFKDSGGSTVTPAADDIVTYGAIADVRANGTANQLSLYGYLATGAIGASAIDTGDPYRYGDGSA